MHTNALFQLALGLSSPWQVARSEFDAESFDGRGQLDLHLDFPRGSRFGCPECDAACPVHDTVEKTWRHLDFFQHQALLHARVPRVNCTEHGVRIVTVPWAREGSGFTMLFEAYVMLLAPQMPIAALARFLRVTDKRLWRVMHWHVEEARESVDMSEVRDLVVDETSRAKRHSYVSLFVEPAKSALRGEDAEMEMERSARVLFVAEGKSHKTFKDFAVDLQAHAGAASKITDVCMDMSGAFQRGAAETMPQAKVTFDRFHVMKLVGEAVDDARRREVKQHPELKGSRYTWLLNPQNLSSKAVEKLEGLSRLNLLTAKAYQMRLNLQELWTKASAEEARGYLREWRKWVVRVARRPRDPDAVWVLEKMRSLARTMRENEEGILNYFRARQTSGVIEGINSMVQAARARARGYRNPETFKTMIYLIAGRLRFQLPATH
jgi:transposase